ncbi:MFS transporter [Candidatus Formimonas warabiya]|uniref:Major facilitator superfamily (MFS) profile domain-containing protein n=1 Tax=Formimonas warabiya TaxID=1761012 RepID=A0A3G1L0Q5_FORW1|nr:MFS transporter [Candidatus Formimonas warabiya]ATW28209.1 hypothetical protein DCMF_28710 [Candidatus Formimonas warabiya]
MKHSIAKWQKTFYTIWAGQVISLITSSIVQYAIIWNLTAITKSATTLSIAALVGFLPMALFSPFIGSIVDRYDRKKIMIFSDLSIATVALAMAVAGMTGKLSIPVMLLALFIRAIGSAFHQPCLQAVTPLIVPQESLAKCNGYTYSFHSFSLILSPAIAAAIFPIMPLHFIILLDILGAAMGICTLAVSVIPKLPQNNEKREFHILGDALDGLKLLSSNKGLFILMFVGSLFSLAYVPANSLYPLLCMTWFGGTTTHAGIVETGFSIGTLLGGFLLGLWGGTKNKMHTMMPALTVIGVSLMGIGLLPANGFVFFVVLAVITGLAAPLFSSLFMSLIQEKIKPEFLGRVLGVTSSMMALACPVGLSLSGAFAEKIGVNNWVVLSGVLTLLCVLLCLSNKNVREVNSSLEK